MSFFSSDTVTLKLITFPAKTRQFWTVLFVSQEKRATYEQLTPNIVLKLWRLLS